MVEHSHASIILASIAGSVTAWSFLGHAVNTFPQPEGKYGKWFLGCLQWLVGQRLQALATMQGVALPTTKDVKEMQGGDVLPVIKKAD